MHDDDRPIDPARDSGRAGPAWAPDIWDLERPATTPESAPQPVNWDTLPPEELEAHWYELDRWVTWLRHTYGLPATVIPPAWHRHPELVWELSALHLHWHSSYHPHQNASAPLGWHRDLADTIHRLRDWTAASGTGLDHDRPTRHTPWPGEPPTPAVPERPLHDRTADFSAHVTHHIAQRTAATQENRP